MISTKKLIKMARKWQKIVALGRKRITFPRTKQAEDSTSTSSSSTEKGHFVIYTSDKKRFVMPIACLNSSIFRELLRMSEEEFGHSSEGPILLPCDSLIFEYVLSLVRRGLGRDLETALLNSIVRCSHSATSLTEEHRASQLLVCGY